MKEYRYDGCGQCLVNTCCQMVCEEYKYHLYKTTGCEVFVKDISLEDVERIIKNDQGMNGWVRHGIV